ncbi:MAG TPA: SDR family NAD(P)-dependent oxidoreductase [Solirubrobacteraceae bacterium]|jgi:dihydroflavonol-4-reductase|nr:SDR family NAD(P)-dependent oxidoreductase [Solirubrobacteraceae bacterium]
MSRTLVTGATGFIGSHVVAQLLERGDDVVAAVRSRSSQETVEGLHEQGVRTVTADVLDRQGVRRALQGVDRLFHIAGVTRLTEPRQSAFAINVEGTRIVLEEALRAEVERVVFTSSVAAVGPAPPGRTADESNFWDAGRFSIPYVDSKHEAEMVAMRLVARGLRLVIVNPAHVLGAGDPGRSSTALVRRFLRRQIPAYVEGTLNVVSVADVARGHLLADDRGDAGQRYILGNRNYTLTRLFADLGRISGVEPPAVRLPLTVALALATAGQRLPGLPPLPAPVEVRAASLNWAFSNRRAKRELGWTTSPHEDCLEETVAFYREYDARALTRRSTRQALPLRIAGGLARRLPF